MTRERLGGAAATTTTRAGKHVKQLSLTQLYLDGTETDFLVYFRTQNPSDALALDAFSGKAMRSKWKLKRSLLLPPLLDNIPLVDVLFPKNKLVESTPKAFLPPTPPRQEMWLWTLIRKKISLQLRWKRYHLRTYTDYTHALHAFRFSSYAMFHK